MIFALPEEIITLQVSFTIINVEEPSFQRPLMWAFRMWGGDNNRGRNRYWRFKIENGPKDLLEVIFRVSNHRGVSRARSSKRSDKKCSSRSKSTCRGKSRGAMVATLDSDCASELVFAVVRILARTAINGGLSH